MQITIEFDEHALSSYTDQFLSTLWHVAQANPAPHGDKQAGEVVERIGREIVRRWLGSVEPEVWKHQGRDHYWSELRRFAKFVPDGPSKNLAPLRGEWVLDHERPGVAAASNGAGPEQSEPAS